MLLQSTNNVMHPALDKLSAIPLSQRWAHPEMLKIRELGKEAIPALRGVLREKDFYTVRILLWVRANWPAAGKFYSKLPEVSQLSERRWAACQALQTLGQAGRLAVPELVELLRGADPRDANSASMALFAIGIDGDVCDQLTTLLETESAIPVGARTQIVGALGQVTPPSQRTLIALTACLRDPSPYVQGRAAQVIGHLQVRTPEIVAQLRSLQSRTNDETVAIAASAALWELEKDASPVLSQVLGVLESLLQQPAVPFPGGGSGGQGINSAEQAFMVAAELFQKMELDAAGQFQALAILEAWVEKSDRIFIRMLLLPAMMHLGFPSEKCIEVCMAGLSASEDYYRLQAAMLLTRVYEKHSLDKVDLSALLESSEVGVRVYGARLHWLKNRKAEVVVPVLIEALDRSKHQSYYYGEIQPVAIETLAEIGPGALAAVGPLEKILMDPNPKIATLAAEAVSKIRR